MKYFQECFRNAGLESIHSERTGLSIEFLQELHVVDNSQTYLARMPLSAYYGPAQSRLELWGDVTCLLH